MALSSVYKHSLHGSHDCYFVVSQLSLPNPRKSLDNSSWRLHISANRNHSFTDIGFPLIDHRNSEYRTMEAQNVSHTVKSHGVRVARTHMHDWLILLLLVVIIAILALMQPFYRFVGKDMMTDLRYPLKSNTVPFWTVPLYAGFLPLVIFLFVYCYRNDVYDLHHAILGLLYSLLVTQVITESIKLAVGRPRPDFFWRCFPDGKDEYDKWGNVICHGDKHVVNEGHKSFPSGHTSISFAGMVFLSLYLSGKIRVFDRKGHIAKICVVILPLLVAALVGISRVDDYWHHWQDVFAGGLLGLTVATICYLQFFPPPYHAEGWGPYAYFHVLSELNARTQEASAANSHSVPTLPAPTVGSQALNEQGERTSTRITGLPSAFNSASSDIETGRR